MDKQRRPFQGVLNILSFNRHFYVMGLGALSLIIAAHFFYNWSGMSFSLILVAFLYGLVMPLIVSAYVYDFSGFYTFPWLSGLIRENGHIRQIVNINAGFDETSFIIHKKFPTAELNVFDFYNAKQHSEPAIKRARKVSLTYPDTKQIASNAIPLPDGSADLIFLLSAVHEIRSHEEKVQFLKECRRLCKPGGQVIMIEHLRDFPNFVAFSIGFTHFFSRPVWKNAFDRAGFTRFQEIKFTPFMSVFDCSP